MRLITEEEVPILNFSEDIIFGRSNKLKNKAKELIDENEIKYIIVDLEQVGFIDSSGIGMLISLFKKMRERKGKMVVSSAGSKVKKVIKLTMLDKIIEIFDSREEALNYFADKGE